MKKITAIIVLLLITISLFSCSSKDSSSKDDYIDFAFEYFKDANISILYYTVEEYESVNINVDEDSKRFDEGTIYKITIYQLGGWNVYERQYFVGRLNGRKILCRYEENGLYSKLLDVRSE